MSTVIIDRIHKGNYQISSYSQLTSINPIFKRDGYEISSWNTSSDGSGTLIPLDKTFNISCDNTIYAMWEKLGLIFTAINGKKSYFSASHPQILSNLAYVNSYEKVLPPYNSVSDLSTKNSVLRVDDIYGQITNIKESAFRYCSNLSSINCPKVHNVGDDAFYYCKNLISVDFTYIHDINIGTFQYCSNLSSINCPNVSCIRGVAFRDCSSLTSMDLPNVEIIEDSFMGCFRLSTIILSSQTSPTVLRYGIPFYDCPSNYTVLVKNETYKKYLIIDYWNGISSHISSITQPIVSFLSGNTYDTIVKTEKLNYAMSAIPPVITREGYELTGWSGNYNDVTKDVSCYAQWKKIIEYGNIHYMENDPNTYLVDDEGNEIVDADGNKIIIGE